MCDVHPESGVNISSIYLLVVLFSRAIASSPKIARCGVYLEPHFPFIFIFPFFVYFCRHFLCAPSCDSTCIFLVVTFLYGVSIFLAVRTVLFYLPFIQSLLL